MKLDPGSLARELHKLGIGTWVAWAQAAGVDESTVTRSLSPRGRPSVHLLEWLVRNGVDLRKVWIAA